MIPEKSNEAFTASLWPGGDIIQIYTILIQIVVIL